MITPDDRPDDRLAALFAADLPPARDPAFKAEVLAGLARRRFAADMAWLSAACGIGALALGAVWPVLSPAILDLGQSLAPAALAVAVAAFVVVAANGRGLDAAS
jgi:hypothetical protein